MATIYRLSGTTVSTGVSTIQIVKTGRVRRVEFSVWGTGTDGQANEFEVGVAPVSEAGAANGSCSNFAHVVGVAATGMLRYQHNVSRECDYPVAIGQSLYLNTSGAATISGCEVLVTIV